MYMTSFSENKQRRIVCSNWKVPCGEGQTRCAVQKYCRLYQQQ